MCIRPPAGRRRRALCRSLRAIACRPARLPRWAGRPVPCPPGTSILWRQAMATAAAPRPMTPEEKKVIFASSLGTVFEWYDFYLYGSLAAIIARQFFSGLDAGSAFIFALLAFAAGFIVRPFG